MKDSERKCLIHGFVLCPHCVDLRKLDDRSYSSLYDEEKQRESELFDHTWYMRSIGAK